LSVKREQVGPSNSICAYDAAQCDASSQRPKARHTNACRALEVYVGRQRNGEGIEGGGIAGQLPYLAHHKRRFVNLERRWCETL